MAGPALTTANPNVIARPSTENEVNELIRTSGGVENVSELARRLGWTRSKLIRFLDQEEGRITRSIGSTGRALIAVSAPVRTPVRSPEQPTEHSRQNTVPMASPVAAGGTLSAEGLSGSFWSGPVSRWRSPACRRTPGPAIPSPRTIDLKEADFAPVGKLSP